MANDFTVNGKTFRGQDIAGVLHEIVKMSGGTNAAAGAVTVDTTRTTARITANGNRRSIVIFNDSSVSFEISPTSGFTLGQGFTVSAQQAFTTDYQGVIYGATSSGSATFRYWEDSNA